MNTLDIQLALAFLLELPLDDIDEASVPPLMLCPWPRYGSPPESELELGISPVCCDMGDNISVEPGPSDVPLDDAGNWALPLEVGIAALLVVLDC